MEKEKNENKEKETGIKSPLSDELEYEAAVKEEAVMAIDSGIMQREFSLAYMRKQFDAIPVPAATASEKDKQAYAREKVKIDAAEVELERQKEYRAFIKEAFNV